MTIDPEQSGIQVIAVKIVDGKLIKQPIAVRLESWDEDELTKAIDMIEAKLKEFHA